MCDRLKFHLRIYRIQQIIWKTKMLDFKHQNRDFNFLSNQMPMNWIYYDHWKNLMDLNWRNYENQGWFELFSDWFSSWISRSHWLSQRLRRFTNQVQLKTVNRKFIKPKSCWQEWNYSTTSKYNKIDAKTTWNCSNRNR